MIWECFLDVLGVSSGCFGNVFWRHFTNQATPCNPSVPGGGCKFADAETKNKCPYVHQWQVYIRKARARNGDIVDHLDRSFRPVGSK